MTQKIRIALVLIFLTASSSGVLFAGQAAMQYAVGYFNEERALSPEESQLANYVRERAVLFQSISQSKSPYILRQKLKILNKKIDYLENQIARNRQRSLKTENLPLVTSVPSLPEKEVVTVVEPPPPAVTPVSRPPEPVVAVEEPIILVRPPTPPPILMAPAKMPPPTVPPFIVPPVETPKPVAVTKVQEPKPTAKMGADWVAMSREEKEMYVFSATGALVRRDVVVMKSSYFYIQALDDTLEKNPSSKGQYLDDLFISSIYENEWHTRTAIDKIKIRR